MSDRTKTGKFKPGRSGNPGGRPKLTALQKESMACIQGLAPLAPIVLEQLLTDEKAPPAVRLKAVEIVLERAYGKPVASVQLADDRTDVLEEIRAEVAKIRDGVTL